MSINATYSKSYNTSRLLKRKRFLRPIIIRLEIFDFISRMAVVVKKFGISSNEVTKCEELILRNTYSYSNGLPNK